MNANHIHDQQTIYHNFMSAMTHLAQNVTAKLGCKIADSPIPHPIFNSIFYSELPTDDAELIDLIIKEFSNKPRCWWITPFSKPAHLQESLRKKGFEVGSEYVGMIYDLSQFPVTNAPKNENVMIQSIQDIQSLEEWNRVLAIGFNFSPEIEQGLLDLFKRLFTYCKLQHFAAYIDKKIVGTGSLFYSDQTCGLYNLAVLPEYREQGIAYSLKHHRLKIAKDLNYTHAVIQSSKEGLSLDKKIGFQERMSFIPYFIDEKRCS